MKIVLLHSADALEPPIDPVIEQLRGAIEAHDHIVESLPVDGEVEPVVRALSTRTPDLVFNLAESFGGKSALESNVAALLNLLGLRYTGGRNEIDRTSSSRYSSSTKRSTREPRI